ncbi:glycosyl transferase family protein [Canicola haemoglobinophilus]|uniref:Glycosyl transferase family protein n=1 Tax=Canicola haemoglobinophilus TaxID=733 RepID=A0AB38HBY1_9PAST|nr:glycosyltransferase family 52 [Canicola haemoglobinophilus]STO55296.1 glycosyl transferase family protein [Canicola haemoglobinophilus]STO69134.1 glycosyl transferase family protein [Canicola haemoglobinophilus]
MNLIICCTPLQVLIAEKIIDLYPENKFYGILFDALDNKKFELYGKRLKNKCHNFLIIGLNNTRLKKIKTIFSILKYKNQEFNKVFLASIDKPLIHILLSNIKFKELYTFDDGTANITKTSFYYKEPENNIPRKLQFIQTILGNKLDINKIKNISKLHYSIYPKKENIIDNIEYISLFEKENTNPSRVENNIRILLGQPIFNDVDKNIQIVKRVFEKYNIDYYFPHPRESYIVDNIPYIDTELIFEDFYFKESENKNIIIYTFFSGAVLNIVNKENINHIFSLKPKLEDEAYVDTYKILESFGIKIIEI